MEPIKEIQGDTGAQVAKPTIIEQESDTIIEEA